MCNLCGREEYSRSVESSVNICSTGAHVTVGVGTGAGVGEGGLPRGSMDSHCTSQNCDRVCFRDNIKEEASRIYRFSITNLFCVNTVNMFCHEINTD